MDTTVHLVWHSILLVGFLCIEKKQYFIWPPCSNCLVRGPHYSARLKCFGTVRLGSELTETDWENVVQGQGKHNPTLPSPEFPVLLPAGYISLKGRVVK